MSIKTKDGVDIKPKMKKQPKPRKAPKDIDYRPTINEYEDKEFDSKTRYMHRIACRLGTAGTVDFGALTLPINDKRALVVAHQDLGESMDSPDGTVHVSCHLESLSCTRHGLVYRYNITVSNTKTGRSHSYFDIDVNSYRGNYTRRKYVPCLGGVIEEIVSSEWDYISELYNKELFLAGLAPKPGVRYDESYDD